MKRVTTAGVPAHHGHHVTLACDLCAAPLGFDSDPRVEIERLTQPRYNGRAERTSVDCCAACFDAKVLPALGVLGFTPREGEE